MKFLIDVHLPAKLCFWLIEQGHEARHVLAIDGMLPDASIWEIAQTCDEIIVSKDSDFFDRAFLLGPPPKVLHIALGNSSNKQLIATFSQSWKTLEMLLESNVRLVSLKSTHIEHWG